MSTISHELENFWPADLHVIGKDIVKFHGIYWPAMLLSSGFELPKQILTTGYFTVDDQKMSKTIGNVIDPVEYCEEYSRDALLFYLFTAFPIGEDGDFNKNQALLMYNAKLSNNLGNLLNRAIALSLKIGGNIQNPEVIANFGEQEIEEYDSLFSSHLMKNILDNAFEYASDINKYVDEMTPWKIDSTDEQGKRELEEVMFTLLYHLRRVAIMLLPFFQKKMRELLHRIGTPYDENKTLGENLRFSPEKFIISEKGNPLYMRISLE